MRWQRELEEKRTLRKKWEIEEFMFKALPLLLKGGTSLDEAIEAIRVTYSLAKRDLENRFNGAVVAIREARCKLGEENLKEVQHECTFRKYRSQEGSCIPDDAGIEWQAVYYYLLDIAHGTGPADRTSVRRLTSPEKRSYRQTAYEGLRESERLSRHELDRLRTRKAGIAAQLRNIGSPRDARPVLVLLAFLSGAGIMLPLGLLPFASGWGPWLKWVVLSLFYVGLIALFGWLLIRTEILRGDIKHTKGELNPEKLEKPDNRNS